MVNYNRNGFLGNNFYIIFLKGNGFLMESNKSKIKNDNWLGNIN